MGKNIWICKPVSGDTDLPIAITASKEVRMWRIKQNLKSFFDQFELDSRQYKIEIWVDEDTGTGSVFNVNTRCTKFIKELSINNNFYIKKKKKWIIHCDEPRKRKEKIKKAKKYKVKPIYHPALRNIIKTLIIDERRHVQYDVIANYLHENKYPIPNTATRKLYMKTLFLELQNVVTQLGLEYLAEAKKYKFPATRIFSYTNLPQFWNSRKSINIICSKMKDLHADDTIDYVEAV